MILGSPLLIEFNGSCTTMGVLPSSFHKASSNCAHTKSCGGDYWLMRLGDWSFELAPVGFRQFRGEVVNVCLTLIKRTRAATDHAIVSIDVSEQSGTIDKAVGLGKNQLSFVSQAAVKEGPEARFTLLANEKTSRLGDIASASWGVSPADLPRFGRFFLGVRDDIEAMGFLAVLVLHDSTLHR